MLNKYIYGKDNILINLYIPRDELFYIDKWYFNLEYLEEYTNCFDIESYINIIPNIECPDKIYGIIEYNNKYFVVCYISIDDNKRAYKLNEYINIDNSQFSLIKLSENGNGQQILESIYS